MDFSTRQAARFVADHQLAYYMKEADTEHVLSSYIEFLSLCIEDGVPVECLNTFNEARDYLKRELALSGYMKMC